MVAHLAALAAYWAGSSSMRHEARSMRHQPPFYSVLSLEPYYLGTVYMYLHPMPSYIHSYQYSYW